MGKAAKLQYVHNSVIHFQGPHPSHCRARGQSVSSLHLCTDDRAVQGIQISSRTRSALCSPFLIGNEHERSHEHSKHHCFLIDLASISWCLDFARTVFTAVFGSQSRHPKRSGI